MFASVDSFKLICQKTKSKKKNENKILYDWNDLWFWNAKYIWFKNKYGVKSLNSFALL